MKSSMRRLNSLDDPPGGRSQRRRVMLQNGPSGKNDLQLVAMTHEVWNRDFARRVALRTDHELAPTAREAPGVAVTLLIGDSHRELTAPPLARLLEAESIQMGEAQREGRSSDALASLVDHPYLALEDIAQSDRRQASPTVRVLYFNSL
ncbi:hypothetical protein N9109_00735 [bacterium]|nr:hypothetical protein [bacterium]MDB4724879.1 hypothetical protein [Planctomycetota bacterium]